MLVIHANWTAGRLHFWGETLAEYLGDFASAPVASPAASGQTVVATLAVGEPSAGTAVIDAERARRHAFASAAVDLEAALTGAGLIDADDLTAFTDTTTIRLRLPADDRGPLPSDRLLGVVGVDERALEPEVARLETFEIPTLSLEPATAVPVLLAMDAREDAHARDAIDFSHSLRYWITVARLVLELLADQRFIPTLMKTGHSDLHGAWQPWLHDDDARSKVGALLSSMPPVVRAVCDEHDGRPWPILDEALRTLTDATIRRALIADDFVEAVTDHDPDLDPHVAWLAGLLDAGDRVSAPSDSAAEMLRDVGRWISELDQTGRDQPLRLALRLSEPPESSGSDGSGNGSKGVVSAGDVWRLSLHLVGTVEGTGDGTGDGSGHDTGVGGIEIDAEQVWRDPTSAQLAAGGTVRKLDELLLAELGRATRVYPRLESALEGAEPTGIDLTTNEASAFLLDAKDLLEESGFAVFVPEWWGQPGAQIGARLDLEAPELAAPGATVGGGTAGPSLLGLDSLVQYSWRVAVGDQPLTTEDFRALARSVGDGCLARLHGRWVQLKPAQLKAAAKFFESKPGGEMTLLEAIRLAHGATGAEIGLPVTGMEATGWVADLLGASSGTGQMPQLEQPEDFIGTLRPYQKVGLSWLSFLDQFGLGACLADDMGLGKTIQLIALLLHERKANPSPGPTLLIAPTSVVANWRRELQRFSPSLSVHVHHGADRPVGDPLIEIATSVDVVITTYTLITRDRETLGRIPWHRVALDEAQYIKNPPTKQTATIRALRTTHRIALTGTPVENRLSELWSIMEFCNPGYLGQAGEFRRRFAVPVERHRDQDRAEQLRRLVRPFVLRRLKTDPLVIDDLPPCVVTKEFANLSREQAALYERTVNEMIGQVGSAGGIQRRGLVLAALVKLKQICDHPALASGATAVADAKGAGVALLSGRSGKSTRLMQMLEEVLATGDKALLFTQFRRMGHLLAAMIQHDLDTEVMFLHGGTPPAKRQQMIDRFQDENGGIPIFILSLKAGGIGVNLTAANHVFHYDRWWNPAVENQATDRAFRIGQTRTVHVHKFVCLGTLEEQIDAMIEQKTELAKNIIGAGEDWLTELSTVQLRELLTLRQSATEADG